MEMSGVMVLTGKNSTVTVCVGEDDLNGGPAPVCTEVCCCAFICCPALVFEPFLRSLLC